MRNRIRGLAVTGLLALAATLQFAEPGRAQSGEGWPHLTNLNALLSEFKAETWQPRWTAFTELVGGLIEWGKPIEPKLALLFEANPDRADEIKIAFIELLSLENAEHKALNDEFMRIHNERLAAVGDEGLAGRQANEEFKRRGLVQSEERGEFLASLIYVVKALKDPRASFGLVGAMGTGGMATEGILELAPQTLEQILEKSQSEDELERAVAVNVLGAMLATEHKSKLDATAQRRIRTRILQAADDKNWVIRKSVVQLLGIFADAESLSILRRLAASDQGMLRGQGDNGYDHFPVRQAAKAALAKIEGRPAIE